MKLKEFVSHASFNRLSVININNRRTRDFYFDDEEDMETLVNRYGEYKVVGICGLYDPYAIGVVIKEGT